ncbi:MAG: type IV toxin-antitoxin system AbiEi family antitoxin [Bacteroidia bacterium]
MRTIDIIEIALEQLEQQTGLQARYTPNQKAELELFQGGKRYFFDIKVRNSEVTPNLINTWKESPFPVLLIVPHLTGKMKIALNLPNISCLDMNGNAYIVQNELFISIGGRKKGIFVDNERKVWNQFFTDKGIILMFYFLTQPDLLEKTYKEIAKTTNVSENVIRRKIKQLATVRGIDLSSKHLIMREMLEEEWFLAYEYKYKPKHFIGRFSFLNKARRENWKDIPLNTEKTVWGGEPAAHLLDGYLYPGEFILYTQESRGELIKNYAIIPNPNGEIRVYEKFWEGIEVYNPKIAPLPVIYIDLLYGESGRCLEAAVRIKENYRIFSNETKFTQKV